MRCSIYCMLFALLIGGYTSQSFAQAPVITEELSWLGKRTLQRQIDEIDDLARIELGTQIRGNIGDLELLQRIINKGLITKEDQASQQALGAVLGSVMAKELQLEWARYKDEEGVSRALCVPETQHCLFPITMLSRRMTVGILPNVKKVYYDAEALIAPFLPKSPYDVD